MSAPQDPTAPSTAPARDASSSKGLPLAATLLVCAMILGAGGAIAGVFIKTKKQPQRETEKKAAPLVEVITVKPGQHPATIDVMGQTIPSRRLVVQSEVGGRIVWHHKSLVPGGTIRKGEKVVRINPRDYQLALQQQRAQVQSQQLQLQMEKGRKSVAEREWELFQKDEERRRKNGDLRSDEVRPVTPTDQPKGTATRERGILAKREPHLKSAQVALRAARSGLSRASLQLSRTVIKAPFNAVVQMENVEIDQLVSPAMQLASLVGTDTFWVQVSLPLDKLKHVRFPKGDQPGSPARVWTDAGDEKIERKGRVIRLLGDLDPVGRMARVLVEVRDPLGLKPVAEEGGKPGEGETASGGKRRLPLLLGSYVHVELAGTVLDNVIEVPRRALQPGDKLLVLKANDTLDIVPVKVIWGTPEAVMVRAPLKGATRLIVSPMAAPVKGMQLRAADAPRGKGEKAGAAKPAKGSKG